MRIVVLVLVGLFGFARFAEADDKALAKRAGKLVISPDAPPATLGELPAYLDANFDKDGAYEALKGPPWTFHVVTWLAKPAKELKVVIADPKAKEPLVDMPVTPSTKQKLVAAKLVADQATGFEAGKTYVVQLLLGKKVLAKVELKMRD